MNLLDIARASLAEAGLDHVPPTVITSEQAAELRALHARIAADWPEAERAESLAVALADPRAALMCFRALAADLPQAHTYSGPYTSTPLAERVPGDDRRTCSDCANLSDSGQCLSAARGSPPYGAARSYHPIADLLLRCEVYAPGPNDPDRRSGAERWPGMVENAARLRALSKEAHHA